MFYFYWRSSILFKIVAAQYNVKTIHLFFVYIAHIFVVEGIINTVLLHTIRTLTLLSLAAKLESIRPEESREDKSPHGAPQVGHRLRFDLIQSNVKGMNAYLFFCVFSFTFSLLHRWMMIHLNVNNLSPVMHGSFRCLQETQRYQCVRACGRKSYLSVKSS